MVDFLMKMNANPHIEDFDGMDSCDYASQQGFTDFKDLLKCVHSLRIKADA